jgi:hypothetical protein
MNGKVKWHKPNGPAFAFGELWVGSSGNIVSIVSVRQVGPGKFDYIVTYVDDRAIEMTKLAWDFQVRYEHIADANIRSKTL